MLTQKIEKRIEELKEMRDILTGNGSKTKYNFCIGELQWIIEELDGM